MAKVDTLAEMYRPMMGRPSVARPRCAVCGRAFPLEQHHIVRRGAGKMYDPNGRELEKPTVTLCGFGSNLSDADGREFCHGLAHHNRLHFKWVESPAPGHDGRPVESLGESGLGHWEFILLPEPTGYLAALGMDGWRRL